MYIYELMGASPPASLKKSILIPFTIMHNHTGLASHQKSVIYIVFSNKMSNEFCFFIFIIL